MRFSPDKHLIRPNFPFLRIINLHISNKQAARQGKLGPQRFAELHLNGLLACPYALEYVYFNLILVFYPSNECFSKPKVGEDGTLTDQPKGYTEFTGIVCGIVLAWSLAQPPTTFLCIFETYLPSTHMIDYTSNISFMICFSTV